MFPAVGYGFRYFHAGIQQPPCRFKEAVGDVVLSYTERAYIKRPTNIRR